MNSRMVLSSALILLLVGGVFSVASYSVAANIPLDPSVGPYTYNLSSSGLISDIVYSANQNSTLLVKSVFASGSRDLNFSASGTQTATQTGLTTVAINNATMYYQGQLDSLGFVTYSNTTGAFVPALLQPNMTLNLNNSVKQIPLAENPSLDGPFGTYLSQDLLLKMDTSWSLFRIDNSIYNGYFFTNGAVSLSNGNTTVHVQGVTNRMGLSNVDFTILVAGFVSGGDLLNLMNHYTHQHQNYHKFTYNPQTGLVSGQYVSFHFSRNTGTITNLMAELPSTTPTTVFTSINVTGNGQMGTSFLLPYLPLNEVQLFGSIFFFANSTYVYGIHNNPALQMNMLLDNGSMKFALPAGMNVSTVSLPYGLNNGFNLTPLRYDASQYQTFGIGTENEVMAGGYTMMLYSDTVRAFLTITGGSAVYYSGNNTIMMNSTGLSLINFVMPPGLNSVGNAAFQNLKYAYQHGLLAGQISCDYLNGTQLNYSFLYNNSLNFKFLGSSPGQVKFQASSGISTGTNLAFYVNSSYLNSTGNIYVYVDSQTASKVMNLNDVINSTGSTPSYAVIDVQGGYMVILHIPHFSTHNITISGTQIGPGGGNGFPLWATITIGVVIVAAIGLVAWVVVRKR